MLAVYSLIKSYARGYLPGESILLTIDTKTPKSLAVPLPPGHHCLNVLLETQTQHVKNELIIFSISTVNLLLFLTSKCLLIKSSFSQSFKLQTLDIFSPLPSVTFRQIFRFCQFHLHAISFLWNPRASLYPLDYNHVLSNSESCLGNCLSKLLWKLWAADG